VHRACGAAEALELLERDAAIDCVVARDDLRGASGVELLAEVARRRPAVSLVLLTDERELVDAMQALQDGRVSRALRPALLREDLAAALDAAAARAGTLRREHELTEELEFTRDALADLLGELEHRLASEVQSLRGVHDLTARLAEADSLLEVARAAAGAISQALGGRAVRVRLASPREGICAEAETEDARSCRSLDLLVAEGPQGPFLFDGVPPAPSLAVYVEDARGLSRRDRRVVESLVSSTSLAAGSQLYRLEREEAQHATVFALARLAERRDNETGRHLVRVSEYSRLIALGLREDGAYVEELSDRFVDDVARSAPLHDIGKVGIPDQILLKPGRLTAEEWEIMRRHTTIGGDTLRSVIENTPRPGFLRVAHDIALYHHEKWNGTGYPEGLARQDIPLCARIVALADVFDALTTRRPYKDPWTMAEALELIRRERGEQFDPAVVDAFLHRVAEVERIRLANLDEAQAGEHAA
jgi:response regulator RpfG family c-di-GMP phosphodiesterase